MTELRGMAHPALTVDRVLISATDATPLDEAASTRSATIRYICVELRERARDLRARSSGLIGRSHDAPE